MASTCRPTHLRDAAPRVTLHFKVPQASQVNVGPLQPLVDLDGPRCVASGHERSCQIQVKQCGVAHRSGVQDRGRGAVQCVCAPPLQGYSVCARVRLPGASVSGVGDGRYISQGFEYAEGGCDSQRGCTVKGDGAYCGRLPHQQRRRDQQGRPAATRRCARLDPVEQRASCCQKGPKPARHPVRRAAHAGGRLP